MFDSLIFAERLKSARSKKHLSQAELAKGVGVSAATISSYETPNGTKIPALDKAAAIADFLDVSLDWLCGKDNTEKTKITEFDVETYLRGLVVVITEMTSSFEELPETRRGNILITNSRIVYFVKQCIDLLKVYRNGTLSRELYETCVEKIISNYDDCVFEYDNFLTTDEAEIVEHNLDNFFEGEISTSPGVLKTRLEGSGYYDVAPREIALFLSEKTIKAYTPKTE